MRSTGGFGRSTAFALAALLALAGTAMACPHGGGKHRPLKQLEHRLESLDLEAETLAAARELLDQARHERRAARDVVRQARQRMHELLAEETPDVAEVLAQAESIGALETEAKKARLRTVLAVRALLTPEQWAQLQEMPEGGRGLRSRRHLF
jgi:Spy/CpxP family protein refolding chaperone